MTGSVRLRLDVAYDGTAFHGWARQPGQRTVQGVLEETLGILLNAPVTLAVAGRTDAGVHASGQVCAGEVPAEADLAGLWRRLVRMLPGDVRVPRLAIAPPGFDPRFSALSRRYAYRVSDAEWGVDPLRRSDTLAWRRPLDESLMDQASEPLLGEHDFAAFCRPREGASTVRTLLRLEWARGSGGVLVADVEADAFCHSMVRALVGALLAVGDGRRPVDWPAAVLAARTRDPAVTVAPAHGLTLVAVRYPADAQVGAQAERARVHRG